MTPPDQATAPTDPGAASPCTNVCDLNTDNVCVGCGRTIDEIIEWGRLTPAEKVAVNRAAADRRTALGAAA